VAELTICHILNLLRNLSRCDAIVKAGGWTTTEGGKIPSIFRGQEFHEKTLGIVGLGAIGRSVARLAKAFGVRVLGTDPYVTRNEAEAMGVEYVDLERVMKESDIVTIHVPLMPSTRGLIGEREIGMMKPTAYLINTSRGAVIDENALIKALKDGRIAGAGLDVFTKEPIPPDNPLLGMENVTLTPHIGGVTEQAIMRTARTVAEEAARIARGELPKSIVNRAQLEEKGYRIPR
jgi:phosphoglycerate dehydrogenase-like enzyme